MMEVILIIGIVLVSGLLGLNVYLLWMVFKYLNERDKQQQERETVVNAIIRDEQNHLRSMIHGNYELMNSIKSWDLRYHLECTRRDTEGLINMIRHLIDRVNPPPKRKSHQQERGSE